MREKTYEILGVLETEKYKLGYTGNPEKALTYCLKNGWRKEQIVFEEIKLMENKKK